MAGELQDGRDACFYLVPEEPSALAVSNPLRSSRMPPGIFHFHLSSRNMMASAILFNSTERVFHNTAARH